MPYTFNINEVPPPMFELVDEPPNRIHAHKFAYLRGRVDESMVPKAARREDNRKLTDIFLVDGFACVSEAFRNAVESVEPGVHLFFPFELQEKDGTPIDARYYLFLVHQGAPCVLRAHSRMKPVGTLKAGPAVGSPWYSARDTEVGISGPAVAGWHLWMSPIFLLGAGSALMSDALYQRFKKDRLKPLRYHEATFYDEPWVPQDNVPELLAWMRENPEAAKRLTSFERDLLPNTP